MEVINVGADSCTTTEELCDDTIPCKDVVVSQDSEDESMIQGVLRKTSRKRRAVDDTDDSASEKECRGVGMENLGFTTNDLKIRMKSLFGEDAVKKTCMSARLFAAFTLTEGRAQSSQISYNNGSKRTRRNESSKSPLVSLLKSYVNVEQMSLGQATSNKKVQFTGFDDSSTKPPRDSILGSHLDRHNTIQAMEHVLVEINEILQLNSTERKATYQNLCSLRDFLTKVQTQEDDYGFSIRQECSRACNQSYWATDRFIKAAEFYNDDVIDMIRCIESKHTSLGISCGVELHIEKLLASSIGRTIRYHLRRFFNPVYGNVTEAPGVKDKRWKARSQISDMIQMTLPAWYDPGCNSAVGDGSMSTIVSIALEMVYQHFGATRFLNDDFHLPDIPDGFCGRDPLQRGLENPTLSTEDQDIILEDTYSAQDFLCAAKACKFLSELLNWPGVAEEIENVGGWALVECYAKMLHRHSLDRLKPSDSAHFILLCDVPRLLKRIDACWEAMEDPAEDATIALDDLWHRFECGTKKRRLRERYPVISLLESVLTEGLKCHMFPDLVEPALVQYEDEEAADDSTEEDYIPQADE